jgi:hypothetical protein
VRICGVSAADGVGVARVVIEQPVDVGAAGEPLASFLGLGAEQRRRVGRGRRRRDRRSVGAVVRFVQGGVSAFAG